MHIFHVYVNIYVKNYNCMENAYDAMPKKKRDQDAKSFIQFGLIKILHNSALMTVWEFIILMWTDNLFRKNGAILNKSRNCNTKCWKFLYLSFLLFIVISLLSSSISQHPEDIVGNLLPLPTEVLELDLIVNIQCISFTILKIKL